MTLIFHVTDKLNMWGDGGRVVTKFLWPMYNVYIGKVTKASEVQLLKPLHKRSKKYQVKLHSANSLHLNVVNLNRYVRHFQGMQHTGRAII